MPIVVWARLWLSMVRVICIPLLSLGCGLVPFHLERVYTPPDIQSLPGLGTVAIFQFADGRGVEPTRISTDLGAGQNFLTEPVAVAVTRAVADGLRRRGFTVIDMGTSEAVPGSSRARGEVAVSGEVRSFNVNVLAGPLGIPLAFYVRCRLLLRVQELETGQTLWERRYDRDQDCRRILSNNQLSCSGVHSERDSYAGRLADVLAATVKGAVNDRGLTEQLARRP
jgi:hypothetical protein